MKKGIHYWALPNSMNLKQKFSFAKKCGFDGVELVILENGGLSVNFSDSQLREVKNCADGEGIAIPSLTNSLSWKCSFTSDNPSIRQLALDTLKKEIDIAQAMGVEVVLALPGFVSFDFDVNGLHPSTDTASRSAYSPSMEVVQYDVAYERALEGFKKISKYAKEAKVTVGVENIWNRFLLSPLEMRSFLDEVGSEYVSSFFDAGNVRPLGIPQQWIKILGSRIKRVHIKDYNVKEVSLTSFVELGKGNIDFKAVIEALKSIGYDSWISAEVNVDPLNEERVAVETSRYMDRLFSLL